MIVLAIVMLSIGVASGLYIIGRAVLVPKTLSFRELDHLISSEGISVAQTFAGGTVQKSSDRGPVKDIGMVLVRATTQSRIGKALGLRSVEQLTADLEVLDKTLESHVTSKVFASVCGFGLPVFGAVIAASGGVSIPVIPTAFAAVVLAVAGFLYPEWPLADDLAARRLDFRQAFSSYLDLVTIYHAGSYGIRDALLKASDAGDGWAFDQIRRTLVEAGHRHQDEAVALRGLGHKLGIGEVVDFGKAVEQTSSKGAVIQDTLIARSDILRKRLAAEAEAEAVSGNEKMAMPLVAFVVALLMFIGFGALNSTSFVVEENPPIQNSNN